MECCSADGGGPCGSLFINRPIYTAVQEDPPDSTPSDESRQPSNTHTPSFPTDFPDDDTSSSTASSNTLLQFSPLNSKLSYMASDAPPALELKLSSPPKVLRLPLPPSKNTSKPPRSKTVTLPTSISSSKRQKSMYGIPLDAKKVNTRHLKVSGNKIHSKHAQYALTAGMMIGIRECVGGVAGVYEEMSNILNDDDDDDEEVYSKNKRDQRKILRRECERVQKYKFRAPVEGKKGQPYEYMFKAYAPLVFSRLRAAFGVEKQMFLHSICGKFNYLEFMSNAKSGQFFFFSHDGRYMIKTQTKEECVFLRKILPRYYEYLMQNPHSFLTHFYGMYRVKMRESSGQCLHFVIMKSVFHTDREIHKIWDLKGSTKGRRSKRGDSVHKDLEIVEEGRKLGVGPEVKKELMTQLERDTKFLAKLGIMDYSLLLGVHHRVDVKEDDDPLDPMNDPVLAARREYLKRSNTPHRRKLMEEVNETVGEEVECNLDGKPCAAKGDAVTKLLDLANLSPQHELARSERDDDSLSTDYYSVLDHSDDEGMHNGDCLSSPSASLEMDTLERYRLDTSGTGSETFSDSSQSQKTFDSFSSFNSSIGMVGSPKPTFLRLNSQSRLKGSNPYTDREDNGIESLSTWRTKEIYFCGIIDILQNYNARKWGETLMRKAVGNKDSEISCVDPKTYSTRFIKFMDTLIE